MDYNPITIDNNKDTIAYNKSLISRFPFLLPRSVATDEPILDFDYSYTNLDRMPAGWRKAFGEEMCEKIREVLVREGCLDEYRLLQVKAKYGILCWYDFGGTEGVWDVVSEYEELSKHTCIRCGKPATRITTGWVSPYCDDCIPSHSDGQPVDSRPIKISSDD